MNSQSILLRAAALTAAALLAAAAGASAQTQVIYAPQAAAPESYPALTGDQLETLVGAIALYPDALVAQILPASTFPVDIVKAARLVRSGAADSQIDQQDWDPSVKAVAHYPSVIEMMDQSLDWTQQLGQAFITQPEDVMQAIQRQRVRAQSVGTLVSTPQQQVYIEQQIVRIVPANPDIIYVPVYDPAVVYYRQPVFGPSISFGIGISCGSWFDLDIDWINYSCYRPGWTWNHWRDNFIVDRDRFIRPRHDFEPHRGDRPPTIWHRDSIKPITFPGHRMTHPSQFDGFRGRDRDARSDNRPTPTHVYTPGADRGRSRTNPNTPPTMTRPRDDRDNRDNGGQPGRSAQPSRPDRSNEPPRATPSPTPRPTPQPQPAPRTRPAGDTHIEPWQTVPRAAAPNPPARVAPPPVHIAPPPAAKPNTPAYVRPSPAPSQAPGRSAGGNSGKPSDGGNSGNSGDRDRGGKP